MPGKTTTTATNRYGSIAAEIYDIDKPFGALPDTAFHLRRLADVDGPILEPACGSGRTLVPLLEAGHHVTGFDTSPEMLANCRDRCVARGFAPDLSLQRFETFTYETRFAAIVIPGASFTFIGDFAVAMAVLRRFYDHLAPGGRLIVDLDGLAFLAATGEDRRCWTTEDGDLLTCTGARLGVDWVAQRERHHIRYERWRDNRLVDTQIEPMERRLWGVDEFGLALDAVGFSDVAVTGNYRPRPPRAGDRIFTFEAVRK
ncbi:MAG: class I SAM-dependent methyltransferase [Caulobacteraceae bacterium]